MSQAEIDAFRTWHEKRLGELNYPVEIAKELAIARERWFPKSKEAS